MISCRQRQLVIRQSAVVNGCTSRLGNEQTVCHCTRSVARHRFAVLGCCSRIRLVFVRYD